MTVLAVAFVMLKIKGRERINIHTIFMEMCTRYIDRYTICVSALRGHHNHFPFQMAEQKSPRKIFHFLSHKTFHGIYF